MLVLALEFSRTRSAHLDRADKLHRHGTRTGRAVTHTGSRRRERQGRSLKTEERGPEALS
jgi:hypothetical protein